MPFKSDKQRRWMYANKPELAKKWSATYKWLGGDIEDFDSWTDVNPELQTHENAMKAVAGVTPGVGDVMSIKEGVGDFQRGDIGRGVFNTAVGAAGLLPYAGPLARLAKTAPELAGAVRAGDTAHSGAVLREVAGIDAPIDAPLSASKSFPKIKSGEIKPSHTAIGAADAGRHSKVHRADVSETVKEQRATDAEQLLKDFKKGNPSGQPGDVVYRNALKSKDGRSRDVVQYKVDPTDEGPGGYHYFVMDSKSGKVITQMEGDRPLEQLSRSEADNLLTWNKNSSSDMRPKLGARESLAPKAKLEFDTDPVAEAKAAAKRARKKARKAEEARTAAQGAMSPEELQGLAYNQTRLGGPFEASYGKRMNQFLDRALEQDLDEGLDLLDLKERGLFRKGGRVGPLGRRCR